MLAIMFMGIGAESASDSFGKADNSRLYSGGSFGRPAEAPHYRDAIFIPCSGCLVTAEVYVNNLNQDSIRSLEKIKAIFDRRPSNQISVSYFISFDQSNKGKAFSEGASRTGRWPNGIVFKPDARAEMARKNGVKVFPSILLKTHSGHGLTTVADLEENLNRIVQ
jgi:hypothetical protein